MCPFSKQRAETVPHSATLPPMPSHVLLDQRQQSRHVDQADQPTGGIFVERCTLLVILLDWLR